MDRRKWLYLCLLTVGAAAAQVLSLALGFEADTGLPRAGALYLLPLAVLLAGAAGALVLTRGLARQDDAALETRFSFGGNGSVLACVLGAFLLLGSAALGLVQGEALVQPLFAALTALCALYLPAALRRGQAEPMMTLPPPYLTAVALLLHFRANSTDPVWAHFCFEVLALAAVLLSSLFLSAFAFRQGRPRLYVAAALMCVPLCVCAALQAGSLAAALRFLGHAAVQAGFLAAFTPGENES